MKRVFLSACMLLCLGVVCSTVSPAQAAPQDKAVKKLAKAGAKKNKKTEKADKKEKPEKKKADKPEKAAKKDSGKIGPVAEVLKDLPYVTDARPNLHAKQYKYMQSATWCRFCNLKMPGLVENYENTKAQGIEIILISADDTEEKARAFMEKYNAPFPCVMRSCPDLQKLPHYRSSGGNLPDVYTVSAEGELLSDGSPMRGRKD